jgi:hypothetical protein
MALVLKPPAPLTFDARLPSVFLAGSIEMGQAGPWQAEVEHAFAADPVVVLNPRRDEWDASWEQSLRDARFRGQVEWELDAQERATAVLAYFDPATKAPVTLLELGLFARSGKVVVCCPAGYWRKGNVNAVDNYFSTAPARRFSVDRPAGPGTLHGFLAVLHCPFSEGVVRELRREGHGGPRAVGGRFSFPTRPGADPNCVAATTRRPGDAQPGAGEPPLGAEAGCPCTSRQAAGR